MTTRRRFLTGAAAALGGAALGLPRLARASYAFGSEPCPYKILEIFLNGALSHRETLWMRAPGLEDRFADPVNLADIHGSLEGATPTGFVAGDEDVYLGVCAAPLVEAGLLNRVRLVAMSHALNVHEVAQDYALTGINPGRPGYSSLGARISTRWGGGELPASFVITGANSATVRRASLETGQLGNEHRPLLIPMTGNALKSRLERGDLSMTDALLGMNRDRYADRLVHPSHGRVRSKGFDIYDHAVDSLFQSPALRELLDGAPALEAIAEDGFATEVGPSSIRVGTYLLANGAQHACVISPGRPGGRDTHNNNADQFDEWGEHAHVHTGQVWAILQTLVEAIDEGELDLDNTLVCIHTEFGRWPRANIIGSNHHTRAYAAMLLGGPITSPGLVGHIDYSANENGQAVSSFGTGVPHTPTDLMAALTLAAGVSPFAEGFFDIGDSCFGGTADPDAAMNTLREEVLGMDPDSDCETLADPEGGSDEPVDDITF